MIKLSIESSKSDVKLVKNLKTSLQKKFSASSYKDIDKAVILSNYLYCLGQVTETIALLDSFIFAIPYDEEREDLWGSIGQGLILRAYIAKHDGDAKAEKNLLEKVIDNDIVTSRSNRYDLYKECLEDHQYNAERATEETPKYKSEIWGQEALTFLYYYEMLPFYRDIAPDNLEKELALIIEKCYKNLKVVLTS